LSETPRAQFQRLEQQAAALQRQANALAAQAARLQQQANALTAQGAALQAQADNLQAQGAALQQQGSSLQAQGESLQQQADSLQTQADSLKAQQQQAQNEQKQALALQQQLTDELTYAGGDDRGTDPRLVTLQNALVTPKGVYKVFPPDINKKGNAATFSVIPTTRPAAVATANLVTQLRTSVIPPATRSPPLRHYYRLRRRAHRWQRRPGRQDLLQTAGGHRRGAGAELHPADDRLPVAADPAAGGRDEPAVRGRGVWRAHRHLPVGLGP
jgi:hypothetical protein